MIRKTSAIIAAAIIMAILAGCSKSNESKSNGAGLLLLGLAMTGDYIEHMSQSAMDSVNDSLTDINNTGTTGLSYQLNIPREWQSYPSMEERICRAEGKFFDAFAASAATSGSISCTSGSVDFLDFSDGWSTTATNFYVIRTFNKCSGPYGLFTLTGKSMIHWKNMNNSAGIGKLIPGSVLEQVPMNKRVTRNSNGMYITVEGNSATTLTDTNDSANTGKVAHTITWSAVSGTGRTFTVDSNLVRKGYTSGGSLLFNHQITTPTPLSIVVDLSAANRSISGKIRVHHVLSDVTLETTFVNLVVPINNCVPSSGTATIDISGSRTASGTITYTGNGSADYSYTTSSGRTSTGSFAVAGCQ